MSRALTRRRPPIPGVTPTSILIGQSAAFSGPAMELGNEMRAGALAYFQAINAAGGINGRKIELRSLDDGYEPDRAAANTKKLIDDGVFLLFGYVGTPTSNASKPIFTAARVPFVGPFTGAESLRNPLNRYIFNIRASYFDETDKIVAQMTGQTLDKIAVFYQNDDYGKAGLAGVQRAMDKRNLKIVATGTVERNTVDVAAAVKSISKVEPQAIIMISAYKSCAAFIKAMRAAGFNPQFMNVSFVGSKALAHETGVDGTRRRHIAGRALPVEFLGPGGQGVPAVVRGVDQEAGVFVHQPRRIHRRQDAGRRPAPHRRRPDARAIHQRDGNAARLRPRRLLDHVHADQPQRIEIRRADGHREGRAVPPLTGP